MRTGHLPSVVFRPTIHFHVTAPFASALLVSSPFASELPDEYWTSMSHEAAFVVLIDTDAVTTLGDGARCLRDPDRQVRRGR